MNSRERFLAVIRGEKPDHPPLFPEGIRDEVLLRWWGEGLPPKTDPESIFYYDQFEELDPDVYPRPGIADWSTPDKLLPLLRRRLDAQDPRRLPAGLNKLVKRYQNRQFPVFLRIHPGLLLSLGVEDWSSFAPALLRMVDQPDFVHQILDIQAGFAARLAEKILSQVDVDGIIFSEPIAGNHGALISAKMYRDFALQSYEKIFPILLGYNVPAIIWRSYANPSNLIPEVLKYPFNALWLCESPPAMLTPAQLRKMVGPKITLIGGIDSDVLRQDNEAIREEIAALRPIVDQGRFIPLADGRVRDDVPYPNYAFYRQELDKTYGSD
jgi:hypothetical protein